MPTRSQRHLYSLARETSGGIAPDFTPGVIGSAVVDPGTNLGCAKLTIMPGAGCDRVHIYRVPTGATFDKSIHPLVADLGCIPATQLKYTDGDPSIVTKLLDDASVLGRQWTKVSFTDSFNRANGNLDAAPASGGWAWVNDGAVPNGALIESNRLKGNSSGGAIATYKTPDVGSSDHYAQFRVFSSSQTNSTCPRVACRLADVNNMLTLRAGSTGIDVHKIVGGVVTSVGSVSGAPTVGDILRLECFGSGFTVKKNGVSILTGAIDPALTSSGTGVNIRNSLTGIIEDFEAGTLAGGKYSHANSNLNNKCMVSADGINWHSRTPADANDATWRSLAYSPSLQRLVAVANGGANRLMTSDDGGDTWTARALTASSWFAVARSEELGLFVIGSSTASATTYWSTDGLGFSATGVTKPTTINIKSLIWVKELGLFVAVGDAGVGQRVLTSPDGKTWTARNVPADNNWQSVAWSASLGLLVAVANSGTNRIMTSPDGINWTLRPSAEGDGMALLSVARGGGKFVACGSAGTAPRIIYSVDGITWFPATATNYANQAVAYSPDLGLFICLNNNSSTGRVQTSPDGINWTQRVNGPVGPAWTVAIWAAAPVNRFVALALTAGINPELLTWPGLPVKTGEVMRFAFNQVGGSMGYGYVDPGRNLSSLLFVGAAQRLWTATPFLTDAAAFCFHTNTDLTAEISGVVGFKETTKCAPQGYWDYYVFPSTRMGTEGPTPTVVSNVMVV